MSAEARQWRFFQANRERRDRLANGRTIVLDNGEVVDEDWATPLDGEDVTVFPELLEAVVGDGAAGRGESPRVSDGREDATIDEGTSGDGGRVSGAAVVVRASSSGGAAASLPSGVGVLLGVADSRDGTFGAIRDGVDGAVAESAMDMDHDAVELDELDGDQVAVTNEGAAMADACGCGGEAAMAGEGAAASRAGLSAAAAAAMEALEAHTTEMAVERDVSGEWSVVHAAPLPARREAVARPVAATTRRQSLSLARFWRLWKERKNITIEQNGPTWEQVRHVWGVVLGWVSAW
mmetsp:Transcript_5284/g.13961  ORF Transcript_5284/g.13961 Transcript_5284/m.13961 type:complete len:293 (+) Transcript_5284:227-1105(+)